MSTKAMKVIVPDGVRIRTSPHHRAKIIDTLGLNEIIEVETASQVVEEGTGYIWWQHANRPDWWSASGTADGEDVYMQAYEAIPIPEDETVRLRVVTSGLNIRTEPRLGNNVVPNQQLQYGQQVRFHNAPKQTDGYIWWEHADNPGWWSASGSISGAQIFLTTPIDVDGILLEVPWIGQIQYPVNLSNDCGHACILMLMWYRGYAQNITISDLYHYKKEGEPEFYKFTNGYTGQHHLQRMVNKATHGAMQLQLLNTPATLDSLSDIRAHLQNNEPVILLVRYSSLNFGNPSAGDGFFDHWVVITGFSGDTFYLNDPLWPSPSSGAAKEIHIDVLLQACKDTKTAPDTLLGVF